MDRLIDSICQTVCGKENYEELCGDLLAIRVIAQNDIPIPEPILKDLQLCMKTVMSRFKDEFTAMDGEGKSILDPIPCSTLLKSHLFLALADDTTPPPAKKQRKLSTPPNSEHGDESTASKPQASSVEKPLCEDENRNVAKPIPSEDTTEDVVMSEAKPSTSTAAASEAECKSIVESKSIESNETKASTSSNSSSSDYELHAEKNVERKLLRKIEYILMDIIQYLNEFENEHLDISSGSNQNTSTSEIINASTISNDPNASIAIAPATTTIPSSAASEGRTETTHNEESPTNIAQSNDATTAADNNSKGSSEV